MDWVISAAVFIAALAQLPALLSRSRKSRRKGTAGGVMIGLGLAFMTIFDPGRSETVEEVRRRRDEKEDDESGAPPLV